MGQKISLSETFSGTGLPQVYDDAIMGPGSLILHDVGHSLGGFSGIPGNGALIPNVAWSTANATLGGGLTQPALSSVISATDTMAVGDNRANSATFPFTERTSRGGLHIVRSQQFDLAGRSYLLNGASAIRDYMYNHPGNAFYYSIWQYYSRAATTRGAPYPGVAVFGSSTGNGFIALQPWEISSPSGSEQPGGNYLGFNFEGTLGLANSGGIGNSLWLGGVTKFTGTLPSSGSGVYCLPFIWGGSGGPYNSYRSGPSQIFYRCYLEDISYSASLGGYAGNGTMSVPARYAEVAARDWALYNAAFATGGRFSADAIANISAYS